MKKFVLTIFVMLSFSITAFAQKDTVDVLGYFESNLEYGTLNTAIEAAIADGSISNTVFKLTPYEQYVLSRSIYLDLGQDLEIYAPKAGDNQDAAPPQILWTEEEIDRGYIIQSFGDVKLSNVWIRYADVLGNKVNGSVVFENQEGDDPEVGVFDGVIFDYGGIGAESGGAVTVKADHFEGTFTNCYWRNNTDNHYRYYGRAVSFPYESTGWQYDKLLFENCTFANLSRVVMMEGNEYGRDIRLNHCTILNTVEWVIQTGWLKDVSVTNSIVVNPFMYGYRAVDVCGDDQDFDDFEDGLCELPGGGLLEEITEVDSLGFEVDFTDAERRIYVANNVYMYEEYMLNWFTECEWCKKQIQSRFPEMIHHPAPVVGNSFYEMQDSTDGDGNRVFPMINIDNETIYSDSPDFIEPATNQDTMLYYMEYKWDSNADVDWSYMPNSGKNQTWPLPENMAYNNAAYKTAAMGDFPLGDLNWYPEVMADWKAQRDDEWAYIEDKMNGGTTDVKNVGNGVPENYVLEQNYPNPFNPTTNIKYSIPEAGFVTLKVYNNLGQEVQSIFAGQQSAGTYQATFNGASLASGIYYYTLNTNNVTLTKKLVLMK